MNINDKNGLINPNPEESIEFLKMIWFYTTPQADCYTIVVMKDKLRYKHWSVSEHKDYSTLFSKLKRYLEKALPEWTARGEHVFYQVLPLSQKPEKGRGTTNNVKVGMWLWVDLDYKDAVDKPEFQGCKFFDDHALECYYQDNGKWIRVTRPTLAQVIQLLREKLGVEPTIIVDSGTGYHLYFKLLYELDSAKLSSLESKLVDLLGGDPQSKDLARILRLPGSINPRVNRLVRVIYYEPNNIVDPVELERRLQLTTNFTNITSNEFTKDTSPVDTTSVDTSQLRELSETEILRIVDLVKGAYRPGYRQQLLLYLNGWLAKARISPLSAVKIVKGLYETTQDQDPLRNRLYTVVYSYKKAGIDINKYAVNIEQLVGFKPCGLEQEIQEDKVKGKSGLQEVLEQALGEEKALGILSELQELLGVTSPYRDSIIELLDYEKQLYAVANLRKLIIARAVKKEGRLIYKERVAIVAPTKVTVYVNPLGGIQKYQVVFEGYTRYEPLVIGPALFEEIVSRLKGEGIVYRNRLLSDILSAVLQAFIRQGKAEIKREIESPGFYLVDDKIVAVRYEVMEPNKDKLKQALLFLNELAEKWFNHVLDKFATVLKWGATAPFHYYLKQKGHWVPILYLHGESGSGKTTMCKVVLRIWGLGADWEKGGGNVDNIARLGHVLSMGTFPVLINEPGDIFNDQSIVDALKNAADGRSVRGKFHMGVYIDIPPLASVIFTSNTVYPEDPGLRRRLLTLYFSYKEKLPQDKQREFKRQVEHLLTPEKLEEIGKCISYFVLQNPTILDQDPLEAGKKLLIKCYEYAGLQSPQWLELYSETEENIHALLLEEFVEKFKKLINDLYSKYVSKVVYVDEVGREIKLNDPTTDDIERKLDLLLAKNMIPGVRVKKGGMVVILSPILKELNMENKTTLKSLAELLEGEYKRVKIGTTVTWGVVIPLEKILLLLYDEIQ